MELAPAKLKIKIAGHARNSESQNSKQIGFFYSKSNFNDYRNMNVQNQNLGLNSQELFLNIESSL